MSQCCKMLNPLFDQIASLSIERAKLEEGSKEWKMLDKEMRALYEKTERVFMQFHPEYAGQKKKARFIAKVDRADEKPLPDEERIAALRRKQGRIIREEEQGSDTERKDEPAWRD